MAEDLVERSDEPIVLKETVEKGSDGLEVKFTAGYVPPLDGSQDDFDAFDIRIAKGVFLILSKVYFGYDWMVTADSKQGLVTFKIPDLMGPTLCYAIRLAQYSDLTPELITRCGGELLERMHLPRGTVDMAAIKLARSSRHTFDFGDVKQ
jgi:hypothetical protein